MSAAPDNDLDLYTRVKNRLYTCIREVTDAGYLALHHRSVVLSYLKSLVSIINRNIEEDADKLRQGIRNASPLLDSDDPEFVRSEMLKAFPIFEQHIREKNKPVAEVGLDGKDFIKPVGQDGVGVVDVPSTADDTTYSPQDGVRLGKVIVNSPNVSLAIKDAVDDILASLRRIERRLGVVGDDEPEETS